jgi:chemotaxis protein methyltransferase CheR
MDASLSPRIEAAQAARGEFAFVNADFERVRRMIHARAGISLHAGKRAMVYGRLSRRLRDRGHPTFASYLQWLESARGAEAEAEWQEFVNCLTTNLTSFFREAHHFDVLADELRQRAGRGLRIWCAAASTGEEPYSIAMTVAETLRPDADVTVLATDIDTRVLAHAARGVYTDDVRGVDPQRLRRHFLRGLGLNRGFVRARPELQRLVAFRPFNLVSDRWVHDAPFDVVFCRNVMIYFDAATQRAVLERLHGVMRPGGLLFAGHSENFTRSADLFRLRGKTVYERVSEDAR